MPVYGCCYILPTNHVTEELLTLGWSELADPVILSPRRWRHRTHLSHGGIDADETYPADEIHPDQSSSTAINEANRRSASQS